jgi:acetyl-CoA C-acetyltransferase
LAQLVTSSVEMADRAPGRAVLWRPSSSSGSSRGAADYRTVSMEMPELNQLLDDHASKDEIVAVFRTADGRPVLAHDGVRGSIRAADAPMVFPNIYHAPLAQGSARLPFVGAHLLADAHQMNLAAFKDLLAARREDGQLFNGRVDSYEVTVTGDVAAQHLGAAAWTGHEGQDATYMWPYMFSEVADEYDRRFGLDDAHLHAIAAVNLANAKRNPNAQTRDWQVPDLAADGNDDAVNAPIEGRIRRFDCSQMTDGGAGVVLVNDDFLAEHPGVRPIGLIEGWGHRTVGLGLRQKLDRDRDNPYVMPHVRAAVQEAFGRARAELDGIDGFEVHDCFTPSEYLAIDHIGLTGPGESWKAVESGDIEIGGRLPINPSGGLIGGGHPVGATGIRMMLDAAKQVSGLAGDYQVDGARRFGTLNIGGSTATTVSFVIGSAE